MLVRPHFQIEGIDVALSLVSRCPKAREVISATDSCERRNSLMPIPSYMQIEGIQGSSDVQGAKATARSGLQPRGVHADRPEGRLGDRHPLHKDL